MGERPMRRRKQDVILSLRGIAAVIATILAFILILMILVIIERLVLG
ncbi:MAG: hypothetical protein LBH64_00040 [Coriobacteriales bacterium]|nr:hypothetical protein [Coriobacteriales bacterium]